MNPNGDASRQLSAATAPAPASAPAQAPAAAPTPQSSQPSTYSSEFVKNCHEKGKAFTVLQDKTADFVSSLEKLDAAKTLFSARAVKAADTIKQRIMTKGNEILKNSKRSKKLSD